MPVGNLAKVALNDFKKTTIGQFNINNLSVLGQARTGVIRAADKVLGKQGIEAKDFVSSVYSIGFNSAFNNNQGFFSGFLKGIKTAFYGMPEDINNRTSPENRINIRTVDSVNTDMELVQISAYIQDQVELKVSSDWGPFMDLGRTGETIKNVFQLATRRALVTKWSSRRIWKGSTPMIMNIPIRFEAVNDPINDVVMACKKLQKLAAPRKGSSFSKGSVVDFFLVPPGPSPFTTGQILENLGVEKVEGYLSTGELTTIDIGGFLTFEKVIIKEVSVIYDNRISVSGHPVGATANVVFETYEMLTKSDLDQAYRPKTVTKSSKVVST